MMAGTQPARTRKKATKEPTDPFAEYLKKYEDDYLACRDHGHAWRPVTASRGSAGTIHRVFVCTTCDAHRNQTLDHLGYIIGTVYQYKTGYLIPGVGRLSSADRAALRIAFITREGSVTSAE